MNTIRHVPDNIIVVLFNDRLLTESILFSLLNLLNIFLHKIYCGIKLGSCL